jgi:hypothetical protein
VSTCVTPLAVWESSESASSGAKGAQRGDSPLHGGNRVDSACSVSSPTHPRPFQPRALTPRQPVGQIGPVGSPPPSPHCRCFTTISSLFPFPVLFHPPRLFHFIYADVPLTDRHLNNATVRSLDDPSKPSRSRSTSHTSQTVARTRTWSCSSPLGSSACSPLSLSSLCSNRLSCLV